MKAQQIVLLGLLVFVWGCSSDTAIPNNVDNEPADTSPQAAAPNVVEPALTAGTSNLSTVEGGSNDPPPPRRDLKQASAEEIRSFLEQYRTLMSDSDLTSQNRYPFVLFRSTSGAEEELLSSVRQFDGASRAAIAGQLLESGDGLPVEFVTHACVGGDATVRTKVIDQIRGKLSADTPEEQHRRAIRVGLELFAFDTPGFTVAATNYLTSDAFAQQFDPFLNAPWPPGVTTAFIDREREQVMRTIYATHARESPALVPAFNHWDGVLRILSGLAPAGDRHRVTLRLLEFGHEVRMSSTIPPYVVSDSFLDNIVALPDEQFRDHLRPIAAIAQAGSSHRHAIPLCTRIKQHDVERQYLVDFTVHEVAVVNSAGAHPGISYQWGEMVIPPEAVTRIADSIRAELSKPNQDPKQFARALSGLKHAMSDLTDEEQHQIGEIVVAMLEKARGMRDGSSALAQLRPLAKTLPEELSSKVVAEVARLVQQLARGRDEGDLHPIVDDFARSFPNRVGELIALLLDTPSNAPLLPRAVSRLAGSLGPETPPIVLAQITRQLAKRLDETLSWAEPLVLSLNFTPDDYHDRGVDYLAKKVSMDELFVENVTLCNAIVKSDRLSAGRALELATLLYDQYSENLREFSGQPQFPRSLTPEQRLHLKFSETLAQLQQHMDAEAGARFRQRLLKDASEWTNEKMLYDALAALAHASQLLDEDEVTVVFDVCVEHARKFGSKSPLYLLYQYPDHAAEVFSRLLSELQATENPDALIDAVTLARTANQLPIDAQRQVALDVIAAIAAAKPPEWEVHYLAAATAMASALEDEQIEAVLRQQFARFSALFQEPPATEVNFGPRCSSLLGLLKHLPPAKQSELTAVFAAMLPDLVQIETSDVTKFNKQIVVGLVLNAVRDARVELSSPAAHDLLRAAVAAAPLHDRQPYRNLAWLTEVAGSRINADPGTWDELTELAMAKNTPALQQAAMAVCAAVSPCMHADDALSACEYFLNADLPTKYGWPVVAGKLPLDDANAQLPVVLERWNGEADAKKKAMLWSVAEKLISTVAPSDAAAFEEQLAPYKAQFSDREGLVVKIALVVGMPQAEQARALRNLLAENPQAIGMIPNSLSALSPRAGLELVKPLETELYLSQPGVFEMMFRRAAITESDKRQLRLYLDEATTVGAPRWRALRVLRGSVKNSAEPILFSAWAPELLP